MSVIICIYIFRFIRSVRHELWIELSYMSGKTDFVPSFRFHSGELFLLSNCVGKGHFLFRLGVGTLLDFGEDFFDVGYRAINWGDGFGGELFCLQYCFV
jgi:hypothetical protein